MASAFSGTHDNARQTLVDRLLDAVKQCQIRFGGKTELATDADSRVSCLCAQWETVLQFGIKSNRRLNPLRHVAGQVLLRPEGESAWWHFLKEHLSPTEIRRFNSLQNVNSDAGRARAWLRSALNEQSLEKYLHSFLGNRQLLSVYFEDEALLMDEERSSILPMMAAGLSSILFAINIDNSEFNVSKQSSSTAGLASQLAPVSSLSVPGATRNAPSPVYSDVPGKQKKKRKKRKANIAIASIENAEYEDYPNSEEAKSVNDEEKSGEKFTNNFISCNNSKSTEKTSPISTPTSYTSAGNSVVALEVKPGVEANLNTNDEGEGYDISQNGANFYSSKLVDVTNQNRKDHGISRTPPRCETVATQAPADEILKTVDNVQEQKSDQTEQLKLRSEYNKKGLTFQEHRSVNDTDQIIGEEPLVELSSGVVLTPVPCSDEARIWALQESNDSEGSGNEGIVDVSNSVTLRLLGRFTRDSPVSSSFSTDDDVGEDTNLAIDATEAVLTASQGIHRNIEHFTRYSVVRTMGDGRISPPKESGDAKEMTSDELKQAIVSMMLRKDEAEECNRSLRQLLDKEMLESANLRLQVDDLKKDRASSEEAHLASVQALSRENELLKHQLKKYVAAVQSLRRNGPLDIAVPGIRQEDDLPVLPERNKVDDSANKEAENGFEKKLIQVADMHGELIELNERLQKMLNIREHQLRRLREELVNLRGPLPDDARSDDTISLGDFGPRLVTVNTRPLINIWIPSAFVQGKTSNVHHIYQVYVRIKDDEWNVYRRYSHFYDMHKKISKQYPGVRRFKFPQKKVIGNRDAKFVEIRRRHLQIYLRKLINYGLRTIPELSENPSKSTLLKCFPLFGNSPQEYQAPMPGRNTQTHYTGL